MQFGHDLIILSVKCLQKLAELGGERRSRLWHGAVERDLEEIIIATSQSDQLRAVLVIGCLLHPYTSRTPYRSSSNPAPLPPSSSSRRVERLSLSLFFSHIDSTLNLTRIIRFSIQLSSLPTAPPLLPPPNELPQRESPDK